MICARCNKEIRTKKDDWVKLETYNKDKLVATIYTHLICWNEQYKEKMNNAFKEKLSKVVPMMNNVVGRMFAR